MDSKNKRQARSPDFLANISRKPMRALFSDADRTVTPLFGGLGGEGGAEADEALGVEALAPPLPAPPPVMNPEAAARLGRAIAELEAVGARTAAEMAATSLELALMVARKIIDAELVADPGVARRLIKAAVRRLGDVHKVTLRVSPDDLEALRSGVAADGGAAGVVASGVSAAGGGGGGGGAANLAAELGVAKVELVADKNLTSGECIVDSDAATVDGRLGTRVEELRRVLEMAIHQESTDLRGPGGNLAS